MNYVTPIFQYHSFLEGVDLYIKRDDFLPFSFGGNKARIAEEFYSDMLAKGKNCMIGYGNPRSNLSRVLANLMYSHTIECHMICPYEDEKPIETNNRRIVRACQAFYHPCKKTDVAATVEKVLAHCKNERGLEPYYIHGDKYGKGNEAVPVRAYAKVYNEIYDQAQQMNIQFDYIFVSTGTGMTQAGLVAGKKLRKGNEKIVGISVARKTDTEKDVIHRYVSEYFKDIKIAIKPDNDIYIIDDYLFGGYGKYQEEIKETIRDMMLINGVPLDTTYTGKGFYGMLDYLKTREVKGKVLFIHTGGVPLFFDNIDILG